MSLGGLDLPRRYQYPNIHSARPWCSNIAAQLSWIKEHLLPEGSEEIPIPENFVITAPPHNPQRTMSGTDKLDASEFESGQFVSQRIFSLTRSIF